MNISQAILRGERNPNVLVSFYYALTQGKEFMDEGKVRYLKRQEERERKALARLAMKYKMDLKPAN